MVLTLIGIGRTARKRLSGRLPSRLIGSQRRCRPPRLPQKYVRGVPHLADVPPLPGMRS
jgi:hypothetical protein